MNRKRTAYVSEPEYWIQIDKKTGKLLGEPKEIDVVFKQTERAGFMITYLSTIISMIENLGNKKMQVVKYILKNMDKTSNILIQTVGEIAKGSGISEKTIRETLKTLEEANIISRRPGVIMLSPKLVHRGNAQKERYLMTKFEQMQGFQVIDTFDKEIEKSA